MLLARRLSLSTALELHSTSWKETDMKISTISLNETHIETAGLVIIVPTVDDPASEPMIEIQCNRYRIIVQPGLYGPKVSQSELLARSDKEND